ncbi:hypothetical protein DCN14_34945 [Burkholderia sp. IDO3]|nr:hypothetical protein DCN14_34945 [Burkholderia sp. IDO3]
MSVKYFFLPGRQSHVLTSPRPFAEHEQPINWAIFSGIQHGLLMQAIAGNAVAFYEAASLEFEAHRQQAVRYAVVMD